MHGMHLHGNSDDFRDRAAVCHRRRAHALITVSWGATDLGFGTLCEGLSHAQS